MKGDGGGMQRRGWRGGGGGVVAVTLFALMASSLVILLCTDLLALLCSFPFLVISNTSASSSPSPGAASGFYHHYSSNALHQQDTNVTGKDDVVLTVAAAENGAGEGEEVSSSAIAEDSEDEETKRCNYYEGRWVKETTKKKKALYSGSSCKRWLSGMWACREMKGRSDFGYEEYKWQPHHCDLPLFDAQHFLHRMRNKVVAFVGDSIGRQQFQSLMCMLTGGDDSTQVEDVARTYGLVKPRGAVRPDGMAQRFVSTNTTVLYYWSATLCQLTPLNKSDTKNTDYAMHLDRPVAFLQKYLHFMDVLVLNTGHHWNRGKMSANRWVMYSAGRPVPVRNKLFRDLSLARNSTVHHLAAWLHRQLLSRRTSAKIFMRSLSPRHFSGGDWDSGGRCDDISVPVEKRNLTGRPLNDPAMESAVLGTSVRLLNVTYISQFRDEAHISKYKTNENGGQDCLHWCLPGVPDVWNELLYAEMMIQQ